MKNRTRDTRWLAGVAMFAAVQLLLNVTGIGLIPLPLIKATTLHIPVIIGAVLLGPLGGGILGGVFGLCSLWTNTMAPSAMSFAFSPFLATSLSGALKAVWIALGCRILIGVVAGWLWIGLKKLKVNDLLALPVVGVAGALTNTVFFVGMVVGIFQNSYFGGTGFFAIFLSFFTLNVALEVVVCALVAAALSRAMLHFIPQAAVQKAAQ